MDAAKTCSDSLMGKGVLLARSKVMIFHMGSGNVVCEGDSQGAEGGITKVLESTLACCQYYIENILSMPHYTLLFGG